MIAREIYMTTATSSSSTATATTTSSSSSSTATSTATSTASSPSKPEVSTTGFDLKGFDLKGYFGTWYCCCMPPLHTLQARPPRRVLHFFTYFLMIEFAVECGPCK